MLRNVFNFECSLTKFKQDLQRLGWIFADVIVVGRATDASEDPTFPLRSWSNFTNQMSV